MFQVEVIIGQNPEDGWCSPCTLFSPNWYYIIMNEKDPVLLAVALGYHSEVRQHSSTLLVVI